MDGELKRFGEEGGDERRPLEYYSKGTTLVGALGIQCGH